MQIRVRRVKIEMSLKSRFDSKNVWTVNIIPTKGKRKAGIKFLGFRCKKKMKIFVFESEKKKKYEIDDLDLDWMSRGDKKNGKSGSQFCFV